MRINQQRAEKLAESLVISLFEHGYGISDELEDMLEYSRGELANLILEHDKDILTEAHTRYVLAVKKCAD